MKTKTLQLFVVIGIAFVGGYFFGVNKVTIDWKNYKPVINFINKEPPTPVSNVDLSLFWSVWEKINSTYYDKKVVDPQKMLYGAINGMVGTLNDPFSVFLAPTQNNTFQQQLAGKFEGIGAELNMKDNQIIVVSPLDSSPAQKAGIKPEDTILKVDGTSTQGWSLSEAIEKIRGPKGSKVVLTILHKGDKNPTELTVTRDTILIKSVEGWIKQVKDISNISDQVKKSDRSADNIMYIQLSQFGDSTNQDWSTLIDTLLRQVDKSHLKGIVLDLRNNPGGYLSDAQFVASEFLPQGRVVVLQQDSQSTQPLDVNRDGKLLDVPLVVLINKGSASASEIVAGALRDNKRAKLIGDISFGKGTIQQGLDLGNGAGLHLTIAKWLTPNGDWVTGKGLTPDIKIALDPKNPMLDTQLQQAIQALLQQ